MKTLIVYEAEDGRQFSDGDACLDYEQNCRATKEANDMWVAGATLMEVLTRANKTRPGWDYMLSSKDRLMLHKITKDTQFVVYSEQPDLPMCKVEKIYNNGCVELVRGDMYGLYSSLSELLRYAHQTTEQLTDLEQRGKRGKICE